MKLEIKLAVTPAELRSFTMYTDAAHSIGKANACISGLSNVNRSLEGELNLLINKAFKDGMEYQKKIGN